jgi:hypothetical protein
LIDKQPIVSSLAADVATALAASPNLPKPNRTSGEPGLSVNALNCQKINEM